MFKKLICLVIVMAFASAAQSLEFSDNFDAAMDGDWNRINYQGWYEQNVLPMIGYPATYPGGPWVIGDWDGYQSLPGPDGISPTMIAHNFVDTFNASMDESPPAWTPGTPEGTEVANGVLRISSSSSTWENNVNSGAFLYKRIEAESFVMEVEIVSRDYWWHHNGGLMARAPNEEMPVEDKYSAITGSGDNEDYVSLSHFPVWGVGNSARDTVGGVTNQTGIKGYPSDPYLRLTGIYGNSWTFFFETSADGTTWASLPGLEAGIYRDDLGDVLQIGIWQANYNGEWLSNMDFYNFSIGIPEPATIALLGLGGLALLRRRK